RPGVGRLIGPTRRLAQVHERHVDAAWRGRFGEERRFLGAADQERLTSRGGRTEAFKLGAAKLPRSFHGGAATSSRYRIGIRRHRVVARAKQDLLRALGHRIAWRRTGQARPAATLFIVISKKKNEYFVAAKPQQ
ncbi:MAG TPA: hypothetical protein VEK75_07805, partial [Xanthobacteraceae bacterium]|nr:hypothetical protein [Xanthobacteraceae bacterium]